MKFHRCALVCVVWVSLLAASALHAYGSEAKALGAAPRVKPVAIVEVPLTTSNALQDLTRAGFNIASVRDGVAEIYATSYELHVLTQLGYSYVQTGSDPAPPAKTSPGKALGSYHDYAGVTAMLQGYAAAYPAICRLSSLGQSVQGRELWVLLITDNPDVEEEEPEFKYVSTMHGNEPVGTEMCLYLIDHLLSNYDVESRITDLVDGTSISIVPLMNPDGLELGSRYNAHIVDLNRAFPAYPGDYTGTMYDGEALHDDGREPEIAHVMNWTAQNSFVLSANLHTGALLVNYPYDDDGVPSGTDAPTPDDLLFEDISRRYSIHNLPMWNSPSFPDGISNGVAWYVAVGGMQDWHYRYAACNEVTIELSNIKTPAASTLSTLWDDNQESMLSYLESVHIGVRGVVTSAVTGLPLWAKVSVQGNTQDVFTDPDLGDYYRMLLPGTYTLTFSASGHAPTTVSDITVIDGVLTIQDVVLGTYDADVNGDGVTNVIDVQLVINTVLEMSVPYDCDINGSGEVDAVDVQLAVNAVLAA
jgi:Zinc carboxypeptidase/Carboxypeptidase regulatory-like domain/Dockerin type I domain